ncbi:uncharacterized protein SCHCODRAFT_02630869 [Schizophyllum commune H4-8]|uniref:uncharacterized protein n=1 Tax=Schizophyllum commune (strain H4-8 / FGSC 9210) TaxID=578458 RepID=UPI00215EACC4|nr:uncharacterized protein SCHCODRAFT_02630869 [Schizophyllum commune H4-8]KAI5890106.1 hypothetical protein SCHCODRAFT_02630869 [Schizophyllum commune H4-8]
MALVEVQNLLQQLVGRAEHFNELDNSPVVQGQIAQLAALMRKQEEDHQHALREVELVLEDALEKEIPQTLVKMVDDRFDAIVDDIVAKETERYLEELAGVKIQREVATLRNTLREKQIQLHNTEARRENSLLREQDEDVPLKKIQLLDGTIPATCPATVKELRSMTPDAVKKLMGAYRIDSAPGSPGGVTNINRVLQHFGVKGCLVTPM